MELVITEKPSAAKRVAEALADGRVVRGGDKGVYHYEISHNGKKIVVASAVGHLYGLAEKEKKKGMRYPVFDVHWVPTSELSKGAAFSKKYLDALKKLAKDADEVTVATDYDVEGEVIGLNVVRYICKRKDAKRMKFSALTKTDLVKAYENASPTIDWGQANAGETRHMLDFYYGINLSRALTHAIKTSGRFKLLSTGRVQGPTLRTIVEREKEIKAFVPVPFWQVELTFSVKNVEVKALHVEDKFWEKPKADAVFAKVKPAKDCRITSVKREQFEQKAPPPFDLTSLQTEAYRCFGIAPSQTLEIAQSLYTAGIISYPRTSSQQLPPSLGFEGIMKQIAKQDRYEALCHKLLKGPLQPRNGQKTDPAHPAIYPTGIVPGKIDERAGKVYDLIVRRFLATFAESAIRETMSVGVDANGEPFATKGTTTVKKGWHEFYGVYTPFGEVELPAMKEGERHPVKNIEQHSRETQPPKRFTEASIIKELEKRELGTKATRASMIDTLYERNYIKGKAIEATELGIHLIDVLLEHAPGVIDVELTRKFEQDMESIREKQKTGQVVLDEAKHILTDLLKDFEKKEKEIGEGLRDTFAETRMSLTRVGKCLKCTEGYLVLRKGKFGRFIACDTYPACTATFKLPASGLVEVTRNVCEHCNHPIVRVIRKGKRPQEVCIYTDCPSKAPPPGFVEHPCKKCGEGTVIMRKSIYGAFGACNKFPKCRYLERIGFKPKTQSAAKPATPQGIPVPVVGAPKTALGQANVAQTAAAQRKPKKITATKAKKQKTN